jgi:hypothetical protein
MWLNGRGLEQMKFVMPAVPNIALGIEETDHALTIRMKLYLIKDSILQFPPN